MTPRDPFPGIPPTVYRLRRRRDNLDAARGVFLAIALGAVIWATAAWLAFGATITVTQDGQTLCSYSVAPRYTAPVQAPMPKERK